MAITRVLHLPPSGRPRWVCPPEAQLDLLYLAWGKRYFAENPIPQSLHPGWVYVLIQTGTPILALEGRRLTLKPGDFVIIGPNCASGWTDLTSKKSEILAWMWRTPPRCSELTPDSSEFRRWSLNNSCCRKLIQFHHDCHSEVEKSDSWTKHAFEGLRHSMEVLLARTVIREKNQKTGAIHLEFATQWMREHLSERDPIASLCEYQQISPSTLHRLFKKNLKETPSSYHQRLRMETAVKLLTDGKSAKEISYFLGYQHPNDFSRAYKKFFGKNIRAVSRKL
jgi:AraC-like DNA-binding protein